MNTYPQLKIFILLICFTLPDCVFADFTLSSQISSQVTRTVSDSISKNLFDNLIIPKLKIRQSSGSVQQLVVSRNRRFLVFTMADGSTRIWDLEVGIQRPAVFPNTQNPYRVAIDEQQQLLFVSTEKTIDTYDFLTGKLIDSLPLQQENLIDIAVFANKLLLLNEHSLDLWNLSSKRRLWKIPLAEQKPIRLAISPDQRYFALLQRQSGLFSSDDLLQTGRLSDGSLIQKFSLEDTEVIYFRFLANNELELGFRDGRIMRMNTHTGKQVKHLDVDQDIQMIDSLDNKIYAHVLTNGHVIINDLARKTKYLIKKPGLEIQSAILLTSGQKLVTLGKNGEINLWNTESTDEILQMITTKQGWTVIDRYGRFDSSEKGMTNISWEAADQDIPLDNFSGKYYEPGLLATALNNGKYINAAPEAVPQGITLPPKLNLSVRKVKQNDHNAELVVDIQDQGGGINKINLFHNAKNVNLNDVLLKEEKNLQDKKEERILYLNLSPVNGENIIRAVASNKMGIEGNKAEISFVIDKQEEKPFLRVVAIGVNEYQDKQLNLDYSIADANAISHVLKEKKLNRFSDMIYKRLYNQQARKLSILTTLSQASTGNPNDVLVIYLAGHGITVNGQWYFLPYETLLKPDPDYFSSIGISATELSEVLAESKIQNILLMIDSCYSGTSLNSFRQLQNSQRHFSRNISKSVGITIVTATRKDQEAAELSDLGHGLFTYVVTRGMEGNADWHPKDNKISAHELAEFSTKTIPVFSKKYLDAAQEPTSFTMGKDFSLLRK